VCWASSSSRLKSSLLTVLLLVVGVDTCIGETTPRRSLSAEAGDRLATPFATAAGSRTYIWPSSLARSRPPLVITSKVRVVAEADIREFPL
jgi:hypothetical protein